MTTPSHWTRPWTVRALRWQDAITINIFWLALTTLAQTNGLLFPLLVQQFVGEQQKGAYLGVLRLWTLMAALLWQAIVGLLSDRSTLRWGRRRPFILAGALLMVIGLALIGFAAGLHGLGGFWFLFAMAVLLSLAANTAHGAQLGLIPDLVPQDQRGRFSAVKAIFEVPLPLILVSFTIARLIAAGRMWPALGVAAGVILVSALLTLTVREAPPAGDGAAPIAWGPMRWGPMRWGPIARLALMTATFTGVILGLGLVVRAASRALTGISSPAILLPALGATGVAAMAAAVALGVWISVRISIGTTNAQLRPAFTWWVVNRLAFFVGVTNLATFAVFFLQGRLGLAREKAAGPAALLMLVIGVCVLLSALPSGYLGDRFGHRWLVGIAGGLAAGGVLVALAAPQMPVIYAGGALIGVATGFFYTSNWALGTQIAPPGEAGRYLGIANLAGAGAGAVGAYIGGPIADYVTARLPDAPGAGYVLLFGIYGVMFLVSVLALRGVRGVR